MHGQHIIVVSVYYIHLFAKNGWYPINSCSFIYINSLSTSLAHLKHVIPFSTDGLCCFNAQEKVFQQFNSVEFVNKSKPFDTLPTSDLTRRCMPSIVRNGFPVCPTADIDQCGLVPEDRIPFEQLLCPDGNEYRSACFALANF